MLKLSISNLSWGQEYDHEMYQYLHDYGIQGLEIAPTRIFHENPYTYLEEAENFKRYLSDHYKLEISSIQSIWYGRTEMLFRSYEERRVLFDYTKAAIDFASTLDCHNLVFGCPRNRVTANKNDYEVALEFFHALGEYAYQKNTVIALEANPVIYNTNFMNSTEECITMIKRVNSKGCMLNLDIGTVIYNRESLNVVAENIALINHIHISEPHLSVIRKRKLHGRLANILAGQYLNYISIEMGKQENIQVVYNTLAYIREVFYGL